MKHIIGFCLIVLVNTMSFSQAKEGTLLANWKVDSLVGSSQYDNIYNEVWGLSVNGHEYGVIGSTAGIHFINVDDPKNPVEDFFVQGASYGPHIIHRDFHDYKGYLYAVSDEDIGTIKASLQIIDISELPDTVKLVYQDDEHIRKAHNIFIDTSQARLYSFANKGGDDQYAPLRAYDISNPLDPVQLGEFRFGIDGVSVGHYHDGFIRDHIAYLNAGFDGLVIVDLTDPENPEVLSQLQGTDYPESGYNHSGWLSDDGQYYFMGDETWGTAMKVFDVSDPRNIVLSNTFDAGNDSEFSIAHNQIVYCNYLFTSYYYDGLQVYNISDPTTPERVLYYPTSTLSPRQNYEGAWGIYPFLPSGNILVSDMQNGLFVIENFDNYCASSSTDNEASINNQLHIVPNPSTGIFTIKSDQLIHEIRIYGISGNLVFKIDDVNNFQSEVSLENNGVYFAEILGDTTRSIQKIIVQN
ncbi:choice-of-anchor B family protein [Portibacter lacus]|uniref:Secretion system C-terminal sorting domain-containing protein n=1 Tax=Portibacter lacus TaxID=1099794 RepID=A0AA37SWU4_9BACT|nr:choice-of-anchor B family protein [Portibacter lacus]GLR19368.1 hypothetical protein GCM10007940_39840 [Portibacter lacus]